MNTPNELITEFLSFRSNNKCAWCVRWQGTGPDWPPGVGLLNSRIPGLPRGAECGGCARGRSHPTCMRAWSWFHAAPVMRASQRARSDKMQWSLHASMFATRFLLRMPPWASIHTYSRMYFIQTREQTIKWIGFVLIWLIINSLKMFVLLLGTEKKNSLICG